MDNEKLARAYSQAFAEFQIEFLHEGSVTKDRITSFNGTLTVKHIESGQVKVTHWSGTKSKLSQSMGTTLLHFISKNFPSTRTAKLFSQAKGQVLLRYAPDSDPKDSGFGYLAHVALRKLCDSPITSLLYRLLAKSSGTPVFGAFSYALEATFKEVFSETGKDGLSVEKPVSIEEISQQFTEKSREILEALSQLIAECARYGSRVSPDAKNTAQRLGLDLEAITDFSSKQQEEFQLQCGNIELCMRLLSYEDLQGMLGFLTQEA